MKILSIIIPLYNEHESIPIIYRELDRVLRKLKDSYDCEIIFVNDGSQDGSNEKIKNLAREDRRVKYLEFSRNFGKEIAITAGIHYAAGDAAIMLDADLQHPPELVPLFVEKWENGAEIVIGIRQRYRSGGIFKRIGSTVFYSLMKAIGESYLIPHATDYRLVDRKVMDAFKRFGERSRITRGLFDWLGFKRDYVDFVAGERAAGQASYSFVKLVQLTLNSFISLSIFPLRVAGYLGVIITAIAGPLGLFMFIDKYLLGDPFGYAFSGTAALAVFIMFFIGVVLICLGLIAMYIAFIHNEVLSRPLYVIRETYNLEK
jgi:polyisoprenyl-phosphate glycosyltransferase